MDTFSADKNNAPSPVHHDKKTLTSLLGTLVSIFSALVAIPLFIIAHKSLPNPDWTYHLDRIFLLIAIFAITGILIKLVKNMVIIGLIIAILYLGYGSLWGSYGFSEMIRDYKTLIVSMYESPEPQEIIASQLVMFPNKMEITSAIDFENQRVRDFSLLAISNHFLKEQKNNDYRTIVQCFAVFKEINSKWNYVSDPKSREYYAKASESVQFLAGDCDDYSIVMAACIKTIGGTPRLVHTDDHLYPEILIGTRRDMDNINYMIKRELFITESHGKTLHFHVDEKQQVWLNLDYTARYPGGSFMSEKNLGVITL